MELLALMVATLQQLASLFPVHLHNPLPSAHKMTHVVSCQWSSLTKAIWQFCVRRNLAGFPQLYKISLENVVSLSDLHQFCLECTLEGREEMASHHVIMLLMLMRLSSFNQEMTCI